MEGDDQLRGYHSKAMKTSCLEEVDGEVAEWYRSNKKIPRPKATVVMKHDPVHGIRTFTAKVHNDNTQIMRFIQRSGLPIERRVIERCVWEILVKLDTFPEGRKGESYV